LDSSPEWAREFGYGAVAAPVEQTSARPAVGMLSGTPDRVSWPLLGLRLAKFPGASIPVPRVLFPRYLYLFCENPGILLDW